MENEKINLIEESLSVEYKKRKYAYKIIVDAGKPYTIDVKDNEDQ